MQLQVSVKDRQTASTCSTVIRPVSAFEVRRLFCFTSDVAISLRAGGSPLVTSLENYWNILKPLNPITSHDISWNSWLATKNVQFFAMLWCWLDFSASSTSLVESSRPTQIRCPGFLQILSCRLRRRCLRALKEGAVSMAKSAGIFGEKCQQLQYVATWGPRVSDES